MQVAQVMTMRITNLALIVHIKLVSYCLYIYITNIIVQLILLQVYITIYINKQTNKKIAYIFL